MEGKGELNGGKEHKREGRNVGGDRKWRSEAFRRREGGSIERNRKMKKRQGSGGEASKWR